MENKFLIFSNLELVLFGSTAVFLFFLFLLTKRFLPFLIKSQNKKDIIKQYIAMFEVGFWFLFIIIAIQQFSDSNQLYAWALFVLLTLSGFWILWLLIKDFIAGAVFKTNNNFKEKDIIQVDNFEGKIIEMGSRILKIESDSGKVIYIPYSRLSQQTIIKVHPAEMVLSHNFTMRITKTGNANEQKDKIRFEILSLPWASFKRPPKVEIVHEDKDSYISEIKLYSLEKQYFFKMEQELRKMFELK